MGTHDATRRRRPCGRRLGVLVVLVVLVGLPVPAGAGGASAAPPGLVQEAKLTASARQFGGSVAVSADAQTALISGFEAVFAFGRSGTTWIQQAKLTGSGEIGPGNFGQSVAVSRDGKTALVAAVIDNTSIGAAFSFCRPAAPTTEAQCKDGGSANSTDPSTGQPFKNEEQCIKYVNEHGGGDD